MNRHAAIVLLTRELRRDILSVDAPAHPVY